MMQSQTMELRASVIREKLNALSGTETLTDDQRAEVDTLSTEYRDVETKRRAAIVAEDLEATAAAKVVASGDEVVDAETRERRELRGKSRITRWMTSAMNNRGVGGAEAEYAAAAGVQDGGFPLELLAPSEAEVRQTTDAEATVNAGTWLDRLFATAAAKRVGITMRSVPSGVASFPVTNAGASGQQQDRAESTAAAGWTVGVTEMKPKRGSVRAIFSVEDQARLPGLEDALKRDLSMALMDSIDAAIFKGDAHPSTAAYDIVGLQTAGISEFTITQGNKVKGPATLAKFLAHVDGLHAESLGDLGIVSSVGANVLWGSTIVAAAVENQTLAQFLRANGMSWSARYAIDTSTSNGDFGAYIGRLRGIEGAGVAAVWSGATMIRDPYSDSSKGEIALQLNYLWDLAFPRTSNFKRLKFVS